MQRDDGLPNLDLYEERQAWFVDEELREEEGLFRRSRMSRLDGDIPVTYERVVLHRARCGHVIGARGSQELLGRCEVCGGLICFRCDARCNKCMAVLCPYCAKTLDSGVFCRRCRRWERLKRLLGFLFGRLHGGLSA